MRTIAFLSQKGGSGKTTLAVHTAVAAEESGEKVFLIDTDPQGSSQAWSQARTQDSPPVHKAIASNIKRVFDQAAQQKATARMPGARVAAAADAARTTPIILTGFGPRIRIRSPSRIADDDAGPAARSWDCGSAGSARAAARPRPARSAPAAPARARAPAPPAGGRRRR